MRVAPRATRLRRRNGESRRRNKIKTKPTYTPGPWTYEAGSQRRAGERESVNRFVIGTPRNERGGRFVTAVIEGPFCGERERHEADARLIAAAPDLLEAARLGDRNIYIEDALANYRAILSDRRRQTVESIRIAEDESRKLREERQENNRRIRAAIAKAEGGR